MSTAFAVFLIVHGAAHGVGFLSVTGLVDVEDSSGQASFLLTRYEPGHPVMWFMGVIWLACMAGFALAGVGVLTEASWALPVLVAATAVSTVLSLLWVKEAPFGIVANVGVILALVIPWVSDRVLP
jgi:hypothetical protein